MASQYTECVLHLMKNTEKDFRKAGSILLKIARNIVNNPEVDRYKSIQIASKTFMESILPIDGAVQCLYQMGFVESEDRFQFLNENFEDLKIVKLQLECALEEKQNEKTHSKSNKKVFRSEPGIVSKILSNFQHVLIYEDKSLQDKARSQIPIRHLEERAQKHFMESPEFSRGRIKKKMQVEDCLLLELLRWFKHEFFTWTDHPSCSCFNDKVMSIGMLTPTAEELKWGAQRVEGYRCSQCRSELRFPRYNHPGKLLETRTGRCGEWANCFTLLCRSMGYDARLVVDWTDHVWTEVFSEAAGRWLHCDPCENICDKPLLYEQGWGKKLSLIIAFSCEELVDVTWRYSDNLPEIMKRRKEMFEEGWMRSKISDFRKERMMKISAERKSILEKRFIKEMVEFVSPKFESTSDYGGRTTGSLQWRRARRELGDDVRSVNKVMKPNTEEVQSLLMELMYFSASDKYIRTSGAEELGWQSLAHSSQNIFRKEEHDWKMVYLARTPSTQRGHISWKIDLTDNKLASCVVKEISVLVQSTVFHSGIAQWLLCTKRKTIPIQSGTRCVLTDEVRGETSISLHAFLSGGEGDDSWQHAQLFRQSTETPSSQPDLELKVKLMNES